MSKETKKNSSKEKKDKTTNTSLRLEKTVLKQLKIKAIERDTSLQRLIESLILEFLEKEKSR